MASSNTSGRRTQRSKSRSTRQRDAGETPAVTYKLLALDVDGTLLRRDGSIHDDDLQAIRRVQAAGVHVTLATGRLYSGTRGIAGAIGVAGPVACVDGSHIVHTEAG